MSDNLYSLLEARFPAPEAIFLETPAGRRLTFGDLAEISGRLARRLQERGVEPGDRVAAQVDKSPEALLLYLACLRAGAVFLPLNTAYKSAEVGYFLGDAEPRVFVCRPETEETLRPVARRAGVEHLETLDGEGRGSLTAGLEALAPLEGAHPAAADDLAAILYTSGTTGRSKGAMLSHGNLASNTETLHRLWEFGPRDVLLHVLPIFHTHGLFVATNISIWNGTPMLFLPRFDAAEAVRLLPRATVMMGVPTFYVRLLAEPSFDREAAAKMRLFISGSAPLLEETFHAFEARTGHRILERYGMSETGMNTSNPVISERRPGTVGFPLPGVECRICDSEGQPVPLGEVGTLEVRGPNVFKGYWRMPEKTAEEFRPDGFFITGDLARIDPEGYISIVGRGKDLIISGGFNVYPKEVELVVDAMPGVRESAVIGLPHPDFGEAVAAVVVPEIASEPPEEAAIVASAKEQLAGFKAPKRVFLVDALPRNAMGKVQKNELRERYAGTFDDTAVA